LSFGPEYHKIDTVYKRDERGVILPGQFSRPEFEYLADLPWRWTEKVHGTNIRLRWEGERVVVGGRTDRADVPAKLTAALAEQGVLEPGPWLLAFDPDENGENDVTVYCEGYGAGIQKGGSYRDTQSVIVYDVNVGGWWLRPDDVRDVADKLGLDAVPELDRTTLRAMAASVQLMAETGEMPSLVAALHGKEFGGAEGVVGTPTEELFDRRGRRIVTKIKLKDFQDLARRGGSQ